MKPLFAPRIESEQLAKKLVSLAEGTVLPYENIREIIGTDEQSGRSLISRAVREAERTNQCLYATVKGVGIRRLLPSEWSGDMAAHRKRLRKAAKKQFKRSTGIAWEKLSPQEQARINAERSLLYFIEQASTDKQSAKIEKATTAEGQALTMQKTLKMFATK